MGARLAIALASTPFMSMTFMDTPMDTLAPPTGPNDPPPQTPPPRAQVTLASTPFMSMSFMGAGTAGTAASAAGSGPSSTTVAQQQQQSGQFLALGDSVRVSRVQLPRGLHLQGLLLQQQQQGGQFLALGDSVRVPRVQLPRGGKCRGCCCSSSRAGSSWQWTTRCVCRACSCHRNCRCRGCCCSSSSRAGSSWPWATRCMPRNAVATGWQVQGLLLQQQQGGQLLAMGDSVRVPRVQLPPELQVQGLLLQQQQQGGQLLALGDSVHAEECMPGAAPGVARGGRGAALERRGAVFRLGYAAIPFIHGNSRLHSRHLHCSLRPPQPNPQVGVLRIVEVPRNLRRPMPSERKAMGAFLDREAARLEDVEARKPLREAVAAAAEEARKKAQVCATVALLVEVLVGLQVEARKPLREAVAAAAEEARKKGAGVSLLVG